MRRALTVLPLFLGCLLSASAAVMVVSPSGASAVQLQAANLLVEEASRRSVEPWQLARRWSAHDPLVVLVEEKDLKGLLPAKEFKEWMRASSGLGQRVHVEGFTVASVDKGRVLVIAGVDDRGALFGAGWLLRHWNGGKAPLPAVKPFFSAPDKSVRGYQIGYRMKNNTYDAWTLVQFEQQMRDLAVFGMNTVQMVAPISDDAAASPLSPAPAQDVVVGLSRLSVKYGLRYDLYYPEMAQGYSDSRQVEAELAQFEKLVRALPRIDSLHVPGGDPGHTTPEVLLPLLEKEAAILRRYHPEAEIWISGQGFNADRFRRFYALLAQKPAWLTGVFFGPQSRDGLPEERAGIPATYPLELYPDIGHTMHAQFPVPAWDPIFALTEGREPICPRPLQFTSIYRHYAGQNSGFFLYSEGVNDDGNKFLWAALGWDRNADTETILKEYAAYLLGAGEDREKAAKAILGLEENWSRPLLDPKSSIGKTHELFRTLSTPKVSNWRWNSLLYRDAYDRYLQLKRGRELVAEHSALQILAAPGSAEDRVAKARDVLQKSIAGVEERGLHERLMALADSLFHQVGLQLSVPKYGASNWERGANLDRIDTPLNDRTWIEQQMDSAMKRSTDPERQQALRAIAQWQTPSPGAFYDDLGDPTREPHLQRGKAWAEDPEMYHAAIDGIADRTLEQGWRLSWLSYAETLYETPLTLRYTGLTPGGAYTVRITYAGEDYALPMKLTANGTTVLHPSRLRNANPEVLEVAEPAIATASGELTLSWERSPGAGGSGRGGQVAEVWLSPRQ